jgi:hypothetical protein
MKSKLFIPAKIKVGFQERKDAYTGKLAYVIYYDEKEKLHKEYSWNTWRDEKIDPIEIDNTPRTGLVVNKGVERKYNWGWGGRSVVRIYDPQGFDFEISVNNLVGIMLHSNIIDQVIDIPCVYSWSGADLVLLPINSEDYQQACIYTQKQHNKMSTRELVKGRQYAKKKSNDVVTYIGYFDWWEFESNGYNYTNYVHTYKGKKHIFHTAPNNSWNTGFGPVSITTLSHAVSNDIIDNYDDLLNSFLNSTSSQSIVGIQIEKSTRTDGWGRAYPRLYGATSPNSFHQIFAGYGVAGHTPICDIRFEALNYSWMIDNSIHITEQHNTQYSVGSRGMYDRYDNVSSMIQSKIYNICTTKCPRPNLTLSIEEYLDVMFKAGYGQPYLVLKNGTKIKHNP